MILRLNRYGGRNGWRVRFSVRRCEAQLPCRVPETLKVFFTASLLGVQHDGDSVEKPTSLIVTKKMKRNLNLCRTQVVETSKQSVVVAKSG